jgi:Heterokaryon incompatibility protein (HET)
MGEIYLKAFLLVIWLGHEQDGSDLAFETLYDFTNEVPHQLRDLVDVQKSTFDEWMGRRDFSIDHQNAIWHAIVKLFDRPWFTRGWIRQEYIFGSLRFRQPYDSILVACGTKRARNLIGVATSLVLQREEHARSHQLDTELFYQSFSSSTMLGFANASSLSTARILFRVFNSRGVGPATEMSRATTLFKLVAGSVFFHTIDPRDKIYCILGLFQTCFGMGILDPLPEGLLIDYTAPIQVVYST